MHEMWDLHTHFKRRNQKYVGDVSLVREVMHSPYLQLYKNPLCCDIYPLYWERKRGLQPGTPVEGNCVHFGASSHCWGRRVVSVPGLNPLSIFFGPDLSSAWSFSGNSSCLHRLRIRPLPLKGVAVSTALTRDAGSCWEREGESEKDGCDFEENLQLLHLPEWF